LPDRITDKFGNRGLDRGGGERKAHGKNWRNQLVDSECFCTNGAGKEYSIEEADDTAEYTGSCHQKGAGDEWVFYKSGKFQGKLLEGT
jgi:hypothetical protein